jgi:hypothetical protein
LRKGKVIGGFLFALGIMMLVVGVVMPYYKTQQRLEGTGPKVEFTAHLQYWITSYIIPPIDVGTPINLSVLSDRPGRTSVLLAIYDQEQQSIVGPALVNVAFAENQKGLGVLTNAPRTSSYMLSITSYNSSYVFSLTSVWSPFYEFRSMTTFGIAVVPLGIITIYYDGIAERREKMFEAAMKNIREKSRPEQ